MNSPTKRIPLGKLHFDLKNPRYGRRAGEAVTQNKALDMIASDFLVDDLLSSIAANGFFEGEPLIAKRYPEEGDSDDSEYTVIEGNRRLAALLILADDPRASGQKRRGEIFRVRLAENNHEVPDKVPVVSVTGTKEANQALAYLGTKHIVGAKQWDSYAKAKWMAEMRAATEFELAQIKEMIGDTGGLVDRMLEGYYVVEQLREAARFDSGQSYIKGRGSNPEFPFSWVYTALGLSGIRKFLHLGEKGEPSVRPIGEEYLQDGADLLEMMFGNRAREKSPVISESRDLGELARALIDTAKSARLRDGVKLETVEEESKPLTEQVIILVQESNVRMSKAFGLLGRQNIEADQARDLDEPSKQALNVAQNFRRTVRTVLVASEEGEIA